MTLRFILNLVGAKGDIVERSSSILGQAVFLEEFIQHGVWLAPSGWLRGQVWVLRVELVGRGCVSEVRELYGRRPVSLLLVLVEGSSLRSWLGVEEVVVVVLGR